jgi:hypothetical protein
MFGRHCGQGRSGREMSGWDNYMSEQAGQIGLRNPSCVQMGTYHVLTQLPYDCSFLFRDYFLFRVSHLSDTRNLEKLQGEFVRD